MLKTTLIAILPLLVFFGNGTDQVLPGLIQKDPISVSGTMEKLIVANGSIAIDIELDRFDARSLSSAPSMVKLNVERDSFFTVVAFNGEFRGHLPGSLPIESGDSSLASKLNVSFQQLAIEADPLGGQYELSVRDNRSGFHFFNIEGPEYSYDAFSRTLSISGGRLLLSKQYADQIGRPSDDGKLVGQLSISLTMRPIEVTQIEGGEIVSNSLPPTNSPDAGTVPGPDVVVGDLSGLAQYGASSGTRVGLAVGTDSCNFGTVNLNWFALPNNDHPVIPQNLYRMSGGTSNDERFEQVGQSSVKHAFTALQQNICSLGCQSSGTGTALGSGCSDPYSASLNSGPSLGSRAWINPFTGAYPAGGSPNYTANNHSGHSDTNVPGHRLLTEISDLVPAQNPGATYYAEAQYITPHEYTWCQANPTQCNMYNNVSHRRYNVTTSASPFSFSPVGATVRSKIALTAWTGATMAEIRPNPTGDGIATIAYKVTNPSPGVWHYEYAIYNQNLDRGIQSFSVPLAGGVTLSNIGFHAPPQHPGSTFDGTLNNAGYSSAPWTQNQTAASMSWSSETFAQNQNANAIRWGTLYNFRFDSNKAPQMMNATIGFYKTGDPITVQVQAPSGPAANVSVSGRVTSSSGRGIGTAKVTLSDGVNTRTAYTSSFGYFRFTNVAAGITYTVTVNKKRYTFTPQQITPNDNLTNVNFTALP